MVAMGSPRSARKPRAEVDSGRACVTARAVRPAGESNRSCATLNALNASERLVQGSARCSTALICEGTTSKHSTLAQTAVANRWPTTRFLGWQAMITMLKGHVTLFQRGRTRSGRSHWAWDGGSPRLGIGRPRSGGRFRKYVLRCEWVTEWIPPVIRRWTAAQGAISKKRSCQVRFLSQGFLRRPVSIRVVTSTFDRGKRHSTSQDAFR